MNSIDWKKKRQWNPNRTLLPIIHIYFIRAKTSTSRPQTYIHTCMIAHTPTHADIHACKHTHAFMLCVYMLNLIAFSQWQLQWKLPAGNHRSLSEGVILAVPRHPRIALSHESFLTGLGKLCIIFKIVYSVGKFVIKGFNSFLK